MLLSKEKRDELLRIEKESIAEENEKKEAKILWLVIHDLLDHADEADERIAELEKDNFLFATALNIQSPQYNQKEIDRISREIRNAGVTAIVNKKLMEFLKKAATMPCTMTGAVTTICTIGDQRAGCIFCHSRALLKELEGE